MKSFMSNKKIIKKKWYCINASGKILGRLSSFVASYLKGKHRITYTPHVDTGDFIIIINASKIVVTGNKYFKKIYYRNTGYPGGLKSLKYFELFKKNPKKILEYSIKGMLPKNTLGRSMFKKLKVYSGNFHKHEAQNPIFLKF
ncbi:50S ribosomal protein L13 [Buchnera aphidicola]|uniref:50S ribosomal protein L13 n=1 Tax=Buchnera aphidicola TaxID=9 RepID=UPI0030EB6689